MTYEEAERAAINAGALQPQGFGEQMAYNFKKSDDWSFQWAYTPCAQGRLQRWTNAILNGVPDYELRKRIG